MKTYKILGRRSVVAWLKMMLGVCEADGCHRRSCCTLTISTDDEKKEKLCKRHICDEHLVQLVVFRDDI